MHPARVLAASRLNLEPSGTSSMGFYQSRVLPRLLEWSEGMHGMEAARQRTVEYAAGHVLEIGIGIGATLPFYSSEVTSLTSIDPNTALNARVRRRLRHLRFPVDVREGRGESLPLKDRTYDCAVTAFALCCVDDLELVVSEISRVLKPGGRFHFAEFGLSRDAQVARWQQRLSRVQRLLVEGCRVDRPIEASLLGAGFELKRIEMNYLERIPRAFGCVYEGLAIKAP